MSAEASQESVQAIYEHAASLVRAGKSRAEVCDDLKARGLNSEIASTVTEDIFDVRAKAVRAAGRKNMIYGALWCVGGSAITAVTYEEAVSEGGSYVIAWGAIVVGGIQFLRGLFQSKIS